MDEFSLIVLEDTLELASQQLPSEDVAECLDWIRNYMQVIVLDPQDGESARKLRDVVHQLAGIADQNRKFLLVTRLQSIVRQFDVSDVA